MNAIWTLLRLCGIAVGVTTLLRLATIGFGVEYRDFFQQFLDQIRNIVELGFLIDPLERFVRGTLSWLRTLGLSIPELAEHWRQVFTLTWLVMLSSVRNAETDAALLPLVAWAIVCSLLVAITTGLVGVDSAAMTVFPISGYVLFIAGAAFLEPHIDDDKLTLATVGVLAAALAAGLGYAVSSARIGGAMMEAVASPGLLALTFLVFAWGSLLVLLGLLLRLDGEAEKSNFSTGLDIVGVMGLALGTGAVMMR